MKGRIKKGRKKLLSNRDLKIAVIFFLISIMCLLASCILVLFVHRGMFGGQVLALANIILILSAIISAVISIAFVGIMWVRTTIYGNQNEHEGKYWEGIPSTQEIQAAEPKGDSDPYLLAVRYRKPIPIFVAGLCGLVLVSAVVYAWCFGLDDFSIKGVVILALMEYALMVAVVIVIRLFRRFRAFHVKKSEGIKS